MNERRITVHVVQWESIPLDMQESLMKELRPMMERLEKITGHYSQVYCEVEDVEMIDEQINL